MATYATLSRYYTGPERDRNHASYLAARKKVGKEHATHWSHTQKVVSDVWFTACSLSRLDVFQGICGGDREAAKLMLPWYMGSKHQDDLPDVEELSKGLVFLLEATVLLSTGGSLIQGSSDFAISRLIGWYLYDRPCHNVW